MRVFIDGVEVFGEEARNAFMTACKYNNIDPSSYPADAILRIDRDYSQGVNGKELIRKLREEEEQRRQREEDEFFASALKGIDFDKILKR